MINTELLLLILGSTAVTYIPRALPVFFSDKLRLSAKMTKFLKLIPYTAMAALIFPGIITTDAGQPLIGIAGGLTAGILAWKKCPVMVCVLAAIAVDFIIYVVI